jgi:hypothetical protein
MAYSEYPVRPSSTASNCPGIGERRFALRAMLEQDPGAILAWLAGEADRWQRRHRDRVPADDVTGWWAARAGRTGQVLRGYASTGSVA